MNSQKPIAVGASAGLRVVNDTVWTGRDMRVRNESTLETCERIKRDFRALIELKAELHRKQSELKSQPTDRGVSKSLKVKNEPKGAAKLAAGKNRGTEKRSEKDVEEERRMDITYERAKYVLQEKSKLYDEMNAKALGYDEDHPVLVNSLVDFQRKAIDRINEERLLPPSQRFKKSREDGDWMDFTDSLGRTRRILKSELSTYIAEDRELNPPPVEETTPEISADEMLRLEKREKWEQQAAELAEKSKVHYQDILFDEIREHGTGYYGFSKDDEQRAIQLAQLKKLSEETQASRKKIEAEKKGKKANLKERLRKIKARKRAKLGLEPEEEKSESEEEEEIKVKSEDEKKEEPEYRRPDDLRAWDFGKPGVYGPQPTNFDELDAKWLKDRRTERKSEFSPPTTYFKTPAAAASSSASNIRSSTNYQNFVKAEPLLRPTTKRTYEPIPNYNSSQPTQPIRDELTINTPPPSRNFERGKGIEIAPPPTFDYYHGELRRSRASVMKRSEEDVSEAIAQGIQNLRKQVEERQAKAAGRTTTFLRSND